MYLFDESSVRAKIVDTFKWKVLLVLCDISRKAMMALTHCGIERKNDVNYIFYLLFNFYPEYKIMVFRSSCVILVLTVHLLSYFTKNVDNI